MPRQYRLYFKRGSAPNFGVLEPGANASLYDHQEVRDAIEQMRVQPHVVGMSLRLGDELFNVIQFEQDALAPKAFEFVEPVVEDEPDTVLADESSPLSEIAGKFLPRSDDKIPALLSSGCCHSISRAGANAGLENLKAINDGKLPERRSFAESYGVDTAQQPVDGDTANDGLVN